MTLPELSVKRHVLAWMLNAVLVLFGVIAFSRIGLMSSGFAKWL